MAESDKKSSGVNTFSLTFHNLRSLPEWTHSFLGFFLILLSVAAGIFFVWLCVELGIAIFSERNFINARNIALVLAALIGAPFVIWRVWTAHRQANIAEESHHADLFTKAIEQLGADKDVRVRGEDDTWTHKTVANIEVRLGGIYALERLSHVSTAFHWSIMEVLTAYIRENSPAPNSQSVDGGAPIVPATPSIGINIQTVATVIGRRRPENIGRSETRGERLDLHNASLSSANLTQARLSGALLSLSSLHRARLNGANLIGADLTCANLFGAFLDRANLSKAHLFGANLSCADLSEADLTKAKLVGADLTGARLKGANLADADLTNANLTGAKLTEAKLSKAYLNRADLSGADLSKADLTKADLTKAILFDTDLADANLTDAKLTGANLSEANLDRVKLTGANLINADLNEARLNGANLATANLFKASLDGVSLTEANLTKANLTEADLSTTILTGANLTGANLTLAVISQEQLNYAIGSQDTILPDGLTHPPQWL